MRIFKGMGDYFALDIGTKAIRVVQLTPQGDDSWSLLHAGYMAVDPKIIASDSYESRKKLGQAIKSAVVQAGISATNCVIGIESSRSFVTMIQLPKMTDSERSSILKYQADKYIPIPVDDAKIDWVVLGDSPDNPQQDEVMLASVTQDYIEGLVDMIDSLGFNVIAVEPNSISMLRAALAANSTSTNMVINVGERSTDVVIAIGSSPRLVRTLPIGLQSFVRTISQGLNVKDDQAQQFLLKFGLEKTRLDGQVYSTLIPAIDGFVSDLKKSVSFLESRYSNLKIDSILAMGFAATIPLFSEYISENTGIPVQITNPWQKVRVPDSERASMAAVEYEYATAVGLAQRVEK